MDHCWKNCSRNCNRPASQLNPKNSFFVPKSFPFNLPLSLSLSLSLAWNPPTVGRLHNLRNCQESVFRRLLTSPPPSLSSLERLQFKFLMREPLNFCKCLPRRTFHTSMQLQTKAGCSGAPPPPLQPTFVFPPFSVSLSCLSLGPLCKSRPHIMVTKMDRNGFK